MAAVRFHGKNTAMNPIIETIGDIVSNLPIPAPGSGHSHAPAPTPQIHSSEADLHLEKRIERLALMCQAMWELLREKTQLTERELTDKVLEVDLRDGRTDGKIGAIVMECPHCHQPTNSKRPTCIICGVELQRKHQFEV